jgi:hypothetical protein
LREVSGAADGADATRTAALRWVVASVGSVESFQNFFAATRMGLSACAASGAPSGKARWGKLKKYPRRQPSRTHLLGSLFMHQIAERYLCAFQIGCLASPRESWHCLLSLFLPHTKSNLQKLFDACF